MKVTPEQLAQTLIRRNRALLEQRRRAAAGRRALLDRVVAEAAQEGLFERMWLIGSLQTGVSGPRSDIDLVCEGLPPAANPALWCRLEKATGASVDLLRIEELDAAFAERVRSEGELLT